MCIFNQLLLYPFGKLVLHENSQLVQIMYDEWKRRTNFSMARYDIGAQLSRAPRVITLVPAANVRRSPR
jgi:hypothetical protein